MLYRDIYAGSAFKGFLTHNIYIFSFETQGLNFIVHADGAWGGYFCSMLREPAGEFDRDRGSSDVRFCSGAEYERVRAKAVDWPRSV